VNRKIFKYELKLEPITKIVLPVSAAIVDVQLQRTGPESVQISMWCVVQDSPVLERTFHWIPTGQAVPDDTATCEHAYVKTVQVNGGALVYHLFVEIPIGEACLVCMQTTSDQLPPKPAKPLDPKAN
jgi:hypothetical protein